MKKKKSTRENVMRKSKVFSVILSLNEPTIVVNECI